MKYAYFRKVNFYAACRQKCWTILGTCNEKKTFFKLTVTFRMPITSRTKYLTTFFYILISHMELVNSVLSTQSAKFGRIGSISIATENSICIFQLMKIVKLNLNKRQKETHRPKPAAWTNYFTAAGLVCELIVNDWKRTTKQICYLHNRQAVLVLAPAFFSCFYFSLLVLCLSTSRQRSIVFGIPLADAALRPSRVSAAHIFSATYLKNV